MKSEIKLAVGSTDEFVMLNAVLEDLADHSRKGIYADWLVEQNDPRGDLLHAVLSDWNSGAKQIANAEEISEVWRNTVGVTLMQHIRASDLEPNAILKAARPALLLNPEAVKEPLEIGTSKFGGHPDLPAGFDWPQLNGKPHMFIGQINLDEIQQTQAAQDLPITGLLSFFVLNEDGEPYGDTDGSWNVTYHSNDTSLVRKPPPAEFDEINFESRECRLIIVETLDLPYVSTYSFHGDCSGTHRATQMGITKDNRGVYEKILETLMPEREESSHLLGWSHPNVSSGDPVDEGMRHLLTVASEKLLEWCWEDGHDLYFSLSPEELTSRSFSSARIISG